MIRTLVFDFGNVLAFFDHRRAIEKLRMHTLMEPTELALILYGGELEFAYERGQITTERYFEQAKEDCRLTCSQGEFVSAFADIFTENTDVTSLVPLLKPHYRLIVGSNTNDAHYLKFRVQFEQVLRFFDHVVTSHEIGARKPHRAFFEHCQKLAECEPGEVLFIDDLPSNVHAAEAFGWQGIVYTGREDLVRRMGELGVTGIGSSVE